MKKFVIAAFHCVSFTIAVSSLLAVGHLENCRVENEEQIAQLRSAWLERWLEEPNVENELRRIDGTTQVALLQSEFNSQDLEEIRDWFEAMDRVLMDKGVYDVETVDAELFGFDPETDVYEGEIVDVDVHNIFN
jgi:hypothetical protein